jgi:predicted RNase H-like nuclease (RuvC/YqgF family)
MGGEMPGWKSQTGRLGNRAEKGRAEIPACWPEVLRMSYEEEKQDRKIEQLSIKIEWLQNANTNFVRRICDQTREIERLRASLIDLHAEYINTLEKNPECSAWDLDEQSDADQKRLRRNAAHAISIMSGRRRSNGLKKWPGIARPVMCSGTCWQR